MKALEKKKEGREEGEEGRGSIRSENQRIEKLPDIITSQHLFANVLT